MERLPSPAASLIWLNPLLRYEKFEARPAGVRAMLPHVDRFLPVHNLKSLVDLAHALTERVRANAHGETAHGNDGRAADPRLAGRTPGPR